jgi:hypothetical protein
VVVGADISMVGVTAGDETAGQGVALGMGSVAFWRGMFATVTVGAPASELGVWEPILDSPACFIPRALGLQFSGLSVNRQARRHGESLGSGYGRPRGAILGGTGDGFA